MHLILFFSPNFSQKTMTFLFRSQFFSFQIYQCWGLNPEPVPCQAGILSGSQICLFPSSFPPSPPPSLHVFSVCLSVCVGTHMDGCTCIGVCVYLGLKLMLDVFLVSHPPPPTLLSRVSQCSSDWLELLSRPGGPQIYRDLSAFAS